MIIIFFPFKNGVLKLYLFTGWLRMPFSVTVHRCDAFCSCFLSQEHGGQEHPRGSMERRSGKLELNRHEELEQISACILGWHPLSPLGSASLFGYGVEDNNVVMTLCDHVKQGCVLSLKK